MRDMSQLKGSECRTSSDAYKCTESSTIRRPEPQEVPSPGVRDRLIGVPDPENGSDSDNREHEVESIPHSVHLETPTSQDDEPSHQSRDISSDGNGEGEH